MDALKTDIPYFISVFQIALHLSYDIDVEFGNIFISLRILCILKDTINIATSYIKT